MVEPWLTMVGHDNMVRHSQGRPEWAEDVKEEELIQLSHLPNDRIDINYEERLSLQLSKDLKKRLKEKVLKTIKVN